MYYFVNECNHNIGDTVQWFEEIPTLQFDKYSYYNELDRIYLATPS